MAAYTLVYFFGQVNIPSRFRNASTWSALPIHAESEFLYKPYPAMDDMDLLITDPRFVLLFLFRGPRRSLPVEAPQATHMGRDDLRDLEDLAASPTRPGNGRSHKKHKSHVTRNGTLPDFCLPFWFATAASTHLYPCRHLMLIFGQNWYRRDSEGGHIHKIRTC
ncbi:unnamed protein product [Fusarium venenatum]|uniref:Uncharacterized protein n=1 Tax=Fusarium venenatum TaxID=56646 RepID=A0A2L2TEV6_9HYPO|nr:uncharacterized protein FVRRES_07373 [Fusarium venenatum]CEI62937.1 unnamed protein product [Fusarium venenatum]